MDLTVSALLDRFLELKFPITTMEEMHEYVITHGSTDKGFKGRKFRDVYDNEINYVAWFLGFAEKKGPLNLSHGHVVFLKYIAMRVNAEEQVTPKSVS